MRYLCIIIITVIIAANFFTESARADTRYVVDELVITLRQGKSTQHKILKTLKTGTPLEVLEEDQTYLRVRTEDGTEGFVLRQYVTSKLPKTILLNELENENSRLKLLNKELQILNTDLEDQLKKSEGKHASEFGELTAKSSALEQNLAEALGNEQLLREKYDTLVSQSEDVIKITEERAQLLKENSRLKTEMKSLSEKYEKTSDSRMIKWFLAGGGVFFFGWIVGKISRKKRSRL